MVIPKTCLPLRLEDGTMHVELTPTTYMDLRWIFFLEVISSSIPSQMPIVTFPSQMLIVTGGRSAADSQLMLSSTEVFDQRTFYGQK